MTASPAPSAYQRSRTIILLLGLIALTLIGGVMWIRGVEPVEVSATIFFIPLFAAVVFFGIPGGLIIGLAASAAYVVIRIPSIQTVGLEAIAGVLIARVTGYLVFGLVGGWAVTALGASIKKLDRFDQVDDETLLRNARSFADSLVNERARATRYQGQFSTVVLDLDGLELDRKARSELMRSLGSHLRANVRSVDQIGHARDGEHDLFGFILPETGSDGAEAFATKLEAALHAIMPGLDDYSTSIGSFPDEPEQLDRITERFRSVATREHPAAP